LRELALHLLDIAENSIAAQAQNITISVYEDHQADRLEMSVDDDGCGMDEATVASVIDPFFTSRTTRKVGLGLPFLKQAAEACNGDMQIDSTPGKGTQVKVEFQHSHIDRMPLGDLAGTFLSLLIANPEINWDFNYAVAGRVKTFRFESSPVTQALQGVPLTEPSILSYLRQSIESGVADVVSASPRPGRNPNSSEFVRR
jgi:anti-sigma regulatory factor (Ser/Thr protein kinase)